MNSKPLISIWMITYNHEKYIGEAIDSILEQKTDFEYEIVIGEDCSTDGTRAILLEYKEKFPDKFKLLLHDENVGIVENMLQTFQACNGEYVAMLEGDDYWNDPTKLQKQVDFLRENPEYIVCYHNIEHITSKGQFLKDGGYSKDYDSDTMKVGRAEMQTSCCVYRNFGLEFPEYFKDAYLFDPFLVHQAGFHGKAKFMDTIQASKYRIHTDGLWSGIKALKRLMISVMTKRRLHRNLDGNMRLQKKIDEVIKNQYIESLFVFLRDGPFSAYIGLWKEIWNDNEINSMKIFVLHQQDSVGRVLHKLKKVKKR